MEKIKSISELEEKLKEKEKLYGGIITNVPRNKVSQFDPRTPEELKIGGMVGGDRMSHHEYAKKYAEYLFPIKEQGDPEILAEVGILTGVGLAIWCDIFPKTKIIGLDIDLDHMKNNMENLLNRGAFRLNKPELYEFDQLTNNIDYLESILKNKKISICIDDGLHSDESILKTLSSFLPHLTNDFTYFIEDNSEVYKKIVTSYPNLKVKNYGELTIVNLLYT